MCKIYRRLPVRDVWYILLHNPRVYYTHECEFSVHWNVNWAKHVVNLNDNHLSKFISIVANKSEFFFFFFFTVQPRLSSQDTNDKLAEVDMDLLEGMSLVTLLLFCAMSVLPFDFENKVTVNFLHFVSGRYPKEPFSFLLWNFVAQLQETERRPLLVFK